MFFGAFLIGVFRFWLGLVLSALVVARFGLIVYLGALLDLGVGVEILVCGHRMKALGTDWFLLRCIRDVRSARKMLVLLN